MPYAPPTPGDEAALDRLLAALPGPVRRGYARLRQPHMKPWRFLAGVLLVCGGFLGFLPLLGFWMVPLGILLLSDDIPFLRGPTLRALRATQDGWDRWRARRRTG